jgi:hypothetical protein
LRPGKKLLDHVGNFVVLDAARKMVLAATRRLEDIGLDVPNLHEALLEFKSFCSLGELQAASIPTTLTPGKSELGYRYSPYQTDLYGKGLKQSNVF